MMRTLPILGEEEETDDEEEDEEEEKEKDEEMIDTWNLIISPSIFLPILLLNNIFCSYNDL